MFRLEYMIHDIVIYDMCPSKPVYTVNADVGGGGSDTTQSSGLLSFCSLPGSKSRPIKFSCLIPTPIEHLHEETLAVSKLHLSHCLTFPFDPGCGCMRVGVQ